MLNPYLISLTNAYFGPLRGMTFIIILPGQITNATCENHLPEKVFSKVYRTTGMSTRFIKMPWRLVLDLERAPPVITDWDSAESYVLKSLKEGVDSGDPFYFRKFIF